jgi:hypothetical protein
MFASLREAESRGSNQKALERQDARMSTFFVGVVAFYVLCITEMIHAMHFAPTWDGRRFK